MFFLQMSKGDPLMQKASIEKESPPAGMRLFVILLYDLLIY